MLKKITAIPIFGSSANWLLGVAAILCVALLTRNLLEVHGPASFRAVIHCPEKRFVFDDLVAGPTVRKSFEVKSVGGKPLIIEEIKLGCDCTTVDPPGSEFPKTIKSGQSLFVTISLDTSSLDLKNLSGKIATTVLLISNDLVNPTLQLTISGKVDRSHL